MVLRLMEIKRKDVGGLLLVLLLGQLVAFFMAISSFTSSLIATLGVDAPLTQSFFGYLLLTLVYVPIVLRRRQKLQLCLFAGFAVTIFMFYTITPFVLQMSGSTLFNLSLLTSDMWAVAIRVLFYHQQINWLYYIAFTVVAIGLIIYSLNDNTSNTGTTASTETAAQYQKLPSEDNSTGSGSNTDSQERRQQEEDYIC